MRFGVFYELQLPKPWAEDGEHRLVHESLEQIQLADKLGIDYAWAVEHHFLDEYSHCSAPETFLAAAAALTDNIKLGHGIRQVIPAYNHPARSAEVVSMLDLVSDGRAQMGIGEGATRMELHGFGIPAKQKRAMSLDAAEQIANMMVLDPYPGYQGEFFSMPCRNVLPKPMQKPHPPMWMACSNRDTIKIAAQNGLGALAFSFIDPEEARRWADIYYGIIKSDECVPIGHSVNANIAMVSSFSVHAERAEAIRRGQEGFEFFAFAIGAQVTRDQTPGRTKLWEAFQEVRQSSTEEIVRTAAFDPDYASGIGTPEDLSKHIGEFEDAGVDQIIFLQQAGFNRHDHICEALNLFADEVLPGFKARVEEKERRKAEELAPYIEAALARKKYMQPLADDEIPVIRASRSREQFRGERTNQMKEA